MLKAQRKRSWGMDDTGPSSSTNVLPSTSLLSAVIFDDLEPQPKRVAPAPLPTLCKRSSELDIESLDSRLHKQGKPMSDFGRSSAPSSARTSGKGKRKCDEAELEELGRDIDSVLDGGAELRMPIRYHDHLILHPHENALTNPNHLRLPLRDSPEVPLQYWDHQYWRTQPNIIESSSLCDASESMMDG